MDEQYKQNFIKAGAIAGQARSFGKSLIKPGASYNNILSQINQKIIDLGGRAAFPPQMALNHIAAHFLPEPDKDITLTNQVIKLDVGVCYHGAIGDCAVTVDLSGQYENLITAAEQALLAAEQIIEVGTPLRNIGKVIEDTIAAYKFSSVKNLSGHGLGYYKIHTDPNIPNYDNKSNITLKKGMTFAIEPFASTGKGFIREEGTPSIFSFIKMKPIQSPNALLILKKIAPFAGLPFAIHHLTQAGIPLIDVKNGLRELLRAGIIEGYAPLIEENHTMVAQAENSVLIDNNGKVFITTRI